MSVYDNFCFASTDELSQILVVEIFPWDPTKVIGLIIRWELTTRRELGFEMIFLIGIGLSNVFPNEDWAMKWFSRRELGLEMIYQTRINPWNDFPDGNWAWNALPYGNWALKWFSRWELSFKMVLHNGNGLWNGAN